MGMFDYVKCECPLPEGVPEWVKPDIEFQTKDTPAQYMEIYVITAEGRLIHQSVKYETVPENERPYWGKPEWKSDFMKAAGCVRSVPTGDVDTQFHGDLSFGCSSNSAPYKFCDFVARFTNGQLEYIKLVKG